MGFALGCLGLSLADFSALSPSEFGECCRAWREERESRLRDDWERMRLLATITIQPHVKGKLKPQQLLPLPWDAHEGAEVRRYGGARREARGTRNEEAAPMGAEEQKKRFRELVGKMSL